MMTKPAQPHRYAYLDGVRGLASLMVAVCHYVVAFQPAMLNGDQALSHFPNDYLLARTGWVFFTIRIMRSRYFLCFLVLCWRRVWRIILRPGFRWR